MVKGLAIVVLEVYSTCILGCLFKPRKEQFRLLVFLCSYIQVQVQSHHASCHKCCRPAINFKFVVSKELFGAENVADHLMNYHISMMKVLGFLKLLDYMSFKLILWPIFILRSSHC